MAFAGTVPAFFTVTSSAKLSPGSALAGGSVTDVAWRFGLSAANNSAPQGISVKLMARPSAHRIRFRLSGSTGTASSS